MIPKYRAHIRSVPHEEWLPSGSWEWGELPDFPDGTVLVNRDGKPGVLDTIPLADLNLESQPELDDPKVAHYMQRIRAGQSIRPLNVILIDGSKVLRDGGCRFVALTRCGADEARAVVWPDPFA